MKRDTFVARVSSDMGEGALAVTYLRVSTKEQAERDGDAEGYSIPAQREAANRKAASLGASVAREFVDRGESARKADRPALNEMLVYIREHAVQYVIVHKVDRLARNRGDDVAITAEIAAAGARLISVTENIDETPSGLLLHGIMSSIAEFYSSNLGAEVVKGLQQKVMGGGTPNRAPIGYLNVRHLVDGYEVRTVAVDPERADLIREAFDAYATGEWSLSQLAAEMQVRGLTFRPGPRRPESELDAKKLQRVLRNRFYIGYVKWRGVEYEGKHERLIDVETFEQVQALLSHRRTASERSYRRDHYLVGSLRCGRCSSRLLYTVCVGRNAAEYGYFYCSSRIGAKSICGQRYLPQRLVEQAVARQWLAETVTVAHLQVVQTGLAGDLAKHEAEADSQVNALQTRIQKIKRERFKWAEKAMNGAVPDDIATEKQRLLAGQLSSAEVELSHHQRLGDVHRQALAAVVSLIADAGRTYASADERTRRSMNQAWFQFLEIDEDGDSVDVVRPERDAFTESVRQEVRHRTGGQSPPSGRVAVIMGATTPSVFRTIPIWWS